jgi:hypothetical protein
MILVTLVTVLRAIVSVALRTQADIGRFDDWFQLGSLGFIGSGRKMLMNDPPQA